MIPVGHDFVEGINSENKGMVELPFIQMGNYFSSRVNRGRTWPMEGSFNKTFI